MVELAAAQEVLNVITSIFKKRPNKNDWKGWLNLDRKNNLPDGTNAVSWVINDGDSVPNEALNILSFMNADIDGKKGLELMLGYNSHFNRTITNKDIAAKLRRANMLDEALQFDNITNRQLQTTLTNSFFDTVGTTIFRPTPNQTATAIAQPETKKMSINIFLTFALIVAGLTLLYKQFFTKEKLF